MNQRKKKYQKRAAREVIDLCNQEDSETETVEYLSSSESIESESDDDVKKDRYQTFEGLQKLTSQVRTKTLFRNASAFKRNDLVGGSGTGLGGVILHHSQQNDSIVDEQKGSLPRVRLRKTVSKVVNSRKRRRNCGKKRIRGKQRRPSNNEVRNNNAHQNNSGVESRQSVWSSREMQIVPYRGSTKRGGNTEPYMHISSLDPALRDVGGAKIIFH